MGNSKSATSQRQKPRHQVLRFDDSGSTKPRNGTKPRSKGKPTSSTTRTRSRVERSRMASSRSSGLGSSAGTLSERSQNTRERPKRFDHSTTRKPVPVRRMMTEYEDEEEEEEALPPPPVLTPSQRQQQRLQSAFQQKRMSLSSAKSSMIVENYVPKKRDRTKPRAKGRQSVVSVLSSFKQDSASSLPPKRASHFNESESHASEPITAPRRGGRPGDKADANFVDYTVVPILLRADMSYSKATEFGELLKSHYSDKEVQALMANPYSLFTALEKEGFNISEEVKRKITKDKYWTFIRESTPNTKRKSYVYYADNDDESKEKPKKPSAMTKTRRHRESVRSEFVQTMTEDSDDEELMMTEAALRQSLRFIDALKQAEKSNGSKEKGYKAEETTETEDIDDLFL